MQVNKVGEGKGSIIINISVGGLTAESNFSPCELTLGEGQCDSVAEARH